MKRWVVIIAVALICGMVFIRCESKPGMDENEVIILSDGSMLQLENDQWLKELINLSKNDKTGHYLGCIWFEKFQGQDIYVTNMMLGSGGVMYWFFDSEGNHFTSKNWGYETCPACNFVGNHHVFFEDVFDNFEDADFALNLKLDVVVYSSLSLPCK